MQDSFKPRADTEINLRELFAILWAHKFIILLIFSLSVLYSAHTVLNAKKKFTASSTFKLENVQQNLNLPSTNNALAGILNFSSSHKDTFAKERVTGRLFIRKLDVKLDLKNDTYFNSYNPNPTQSAWKGAIKKIIGWKKVEVNHDEAIWQGITQTFKDSLSITDTDAGTTIISITHTDAIRAAKVANEIMSQIIYDLEQEKDIEQTGQLSYLSKTLANALNELELAETRLKTFALENSALPLESFAAGSIELDDLRDQLFRTTELHDAVAELVFLLKNKTTSEKDYILLRKKYPIVDQVEFRRILGQNEIVNFWSWPVLKSVNDVLDTLSERKSRLKSKMEASQIEANRSSEALELYAKLEREVAIANATYTVLIEQVKAQSMLAGYKSSISEIYEYAAPPIGPSHPNRSLLLQFGAAMGLCLGGIIVLIYGTLRGVYYSRRSLVLASKAQFNFNATKIMPLRKLSLGQIARLLIKKPRKVVRDLAIEIQKDGSNPILITSSRAKIKSRDLARILATYMQSNGSKVALINFSSATIKIKNNSSKMINDCFHVLENEENVFELYSNNKSGALESLSDTNFTNNLENLKKSFDFIFICADNDNAMSLLRAVEKLKPFHIALARVKHTKFRTISDMHTITPIKGLLHV
jgi:uncharacterized protein involved in exopolysaccharide biosynthesis